MCRQQDQRELRRQRKRLRDLAGEEIDSEPLVDTDDVEELCRELSREQLESLCAQLQAASNEDEKRRAVDDAVQQMYSTRGEVRPMSIRTMLSSWCMLLTILCRLTVGSKGHAERAQAVPVLMLRLRSSRAGSSRLRSQLCVCLLTCRLIACASCMHRMQTLAEGLHCQPPC
jgi:hypothetical protein